MVLPMDAKVVLMEHITYDCFHRELGGSTKLVIDVIRYDPPNVKVQDVVSLVPRLLGTRLKILYSHTYALFKVHKNESYVKLPGQRKQLTFNLNLSMYASAQA